MLVNLHNSLKLNYWKYDRDYFNEEIIQAQDNPRDSFKRFFCIIIKHSNNQFSIIQDYNFLIN